MSIAIAAFKPNGFYIQPIGKNSNGTDKKPIDITNSLLFFDYYEDILSPCIFATAMIMNSASIFNILPIRGGEKVGIDVNTAFGNFKFDGDKAFYVYKVSGLNAENTNEYFTLHLVSKEGLTNETSRCEKKYANATIDTHVKDILKNTLKTNKIGTIEQTSNSYSFIGNIKKPFHTLIWLGPKSVPLTPGASGVDGEYVHAKAKGTAGYFFYENKDGFNFRSIYSLVSNTQLQLSSSDKEKYPIYTGGPVTINANDPSNDFKILNYDFEKNIDLLRSLRVGMYSNKTYFYDLYSNTLDIYKYNLSEEIQNKLGTYELSIPDDFKDSISRIMSRTSDRGALNSDGSIGSKNLSGADMSKSFSRYNILFTQALNMTVPMNVNLKAGDIIRCEFPRIEKSDKSEIEKETSGYYVIKELRHHFESGKMITGLRVIRDSYGLYGPNQ